MINGFLIKIFFSFTKMSKNFSARYYQKSKERLQKKAHENYQDLSEEEKDKEQEYGHEQYKSLPQHEKQRPAEFRKKYKIWKSETISKIKTGWCFLASNCMQDVFQYTYIKPFLNISVFGKYKSLLEIPVSR